jgi:hypothetical protein
MKYLRNFKLFESINEEDIKLSEIEPYLLDFKQLGCAWTISFSSSREIEFPSSKLYISSINLDSYSKIDINNTRRFSTIRTLDIELRPEGDILGKIKMSLEEFSDAVNLISDYLNSDHGLELNYIYISNDWSYLYFPSVENILKSDYARIIANRITLNFK